MAPLGEMNSDAFVVDKVGEGRKKHSRNNVRRPQDARACKQSGTEATFVSDPRIWESISTEGVADRPSGVRVTARRDAMLRRALAATDVAALALSLMVTDLIFRQSHLGPQITCLLLIPMVVIIGKAIGLYDRDQHLLRKSTIDEMPLLFNFAALMSVAIWLCEVVLFSGSLSRPQVFVLGAAGFGFLAAGRTVTRSLVVRNTLPERCLVVGGAEDCDRAEEVLTGERSGGTNATVVGRVQLGGPASGAYDGNDLSAVSAVVAELIERNAVERVIIAPDASDAPDDVLELIRAIKAIGVKLSVLPRLLEVVGSASNFDDVDGVAMFAVRPYGLTKSSQILKRSLDLAVSTLALAVLSPLLALIALAVKLDSPGPVLFRQKRSGLRGEQFDMFKFRSMVQDADAAKDRLRARNEAGDGLFKITEDPRITRTGKLLRRTSLDELPQLLNVLNGTMSLVGPRPLVPDEDALIFGWRRRRHSLKPGMTGMWQVCGSSRIPLAEMVKIDYMYGANWSLWLDVKILLRTIPYVLARRGR